MKNLRLSSKAKHSLIIAGLVVAALVLIVAVFSLINHFSADNRYEKYYEEGALSYISEKYDKALDSLEKALKLKDTEECYLLLADVYYKGKGDLDKAIEVLYVGSYKLSSSKINSYLEELKAEKLKAGGASDADGVTIGRQTVSRDTTTLALSKMGLGDSDILPIAELTKLKNLTLSENRLTSVAPLENLSDLTFLHLGGNNIEDISPLSGLSSLKTLYLDGNPIRDFAPLRALKSLTTLSIVDIDISEDELKSLQDALPNCSIHCDSAVSNPVEITMGTVTFMSDVTELDLSDQNLTDITPLCQCKNLVKLILKNNKIEDLTPLMDLPDLTWLSIWNNKVSDIRPLMGLTKLSYLDADANLIRDISTLSELVNMEELWLSYNPIENIGALKSMTSLRRLGLKSTGLEDQDLDVLMGMTSLAELALEENTDLSAEKLDELKEALLHCIITHSDAYYTVDFGGNEFKSDAREISLYGAAAPSLTGLEKFSALENLILLNCGTNDISAIRDLDALAVLEVTNESFATSDRLCDISALSGHSSLSILNLMSNNISDIRALSGLTGLRELHLSFNPISDISALSGLAGLKELSLDYCRISDVSALSSLTGLTYLGLENNSISDLTPLKSLTNLETLYIGSNNVTADQVRELQEALPGCAIYTDLDLTVEEAPSEELSPSDGILPVVE